MRLLLLLLTFLFVQVTAAQSVLRVNYYYVADSSYDDLLAPATQLKSVGVADKPVFSTDSMAYQMIRDTTEILGQVFQMTHRYDTGTKLQIHIHWMQTYAAENPRFVVSYKITGIGRFWPVAYTYMVCQNKEAAYTSGAMHQVSNCKWIYGTGLGISGLIDVRVRRTLAGSGDVGRTNVMLKSVDIHYRNNSPGSSKASSK